MLASYSPLTPGWMASVALLRLPGAPGAAAERRGGPLHSWSSRDSFTICFRRFTTGQGCLVAVNFPRGPSRYLHFLGWRLLRQRRDEAETQRCDGERERVVEGKGRTRAIRCWSRFFRGNLLPASLPTTCGQFVNSSLPATVLFKPAYPNFSFLAITWCLLHKW